MAVARLEIWAQATDLMFTSVISDSPRMRPRSQNAPDPQDASTNLTKDHFTIYLIRSSFSMNCFTHRPKSGLPRNIAIG